MKQSGIEAAVYWALDLANNLCFTLSSVIVIVCFPFFTW
jgi:hypothetical protein